MRGDSENHLPPVARRRRGVNERDSGLLSKFGMYLNFGKRWSARHRWSRVKERNSGLPSKLLGLLESKSRVPRQNPISQCHLVKMGLLGAEQMAGTVLALQQPLRLLVKRGLQGLRSTAPRQDSQSLSLLAKVKSVGEIRPPGIAEYTCEFPTSCWENIAGQVVGYRTVAESAKRSGRKCEPASRFQAIQAHDDLLREEATGESLPKWHPVNGRPLFRRVTPSTVGMV